MERSILNTSFDLETITALESSNYRLHVLHIYFQVYFPPFVCKSFGLIWWPHRDPWISHICCLPIWKNQYFIAKVKMQNKKKSTKTMTKLSVAYLCEIINELQNSKLVLLTLAHKERECVPCWVTRIRRQNQQGVRGGSHLLGSKWSSFWVAGSADCTKGQQSPPPPSHQRMLLKQLVPDHHVKSAIVISM